MRAMFSRILIAGWVFLAAILFLLVFLPRLALRIPHLELLRPLIIILGLASIGYGVVWVYRKGMSRTRSK